MKQKAITKVLNVCDKTKEQMISYYEELKREKTPPYSVFQAVDGDTIVTMYTSGKVVFQGVDADLASDYWIATEKINSGRNALVEKDKKEDKKEERVIPLNVSSIGSDEVGTGDFFGPIVVTASYVSRDNVSYLIDLGVKDSKKLTDDKIKEIVPKIIQKVPYQTLVLDNYKYNTFYGEDMNMNKIKAVLHNKVLCEMVNKGYLYDYVVVDQFEYPGSYFKHIKDSKYQFKDITFLTKAEDKCLSVACASMISRYIFLNEMDKLSKKYNIEIPKGAGNEADKVYKFIKDKYGNDELKYVCKLNFNNAKKISDSNE